MMRIGVFCSLVSVLLLAGCASQQRSSTVSTQSTSVAQTTRDGVMVHVKSGPDDPHAVLMALQMAKVMSVDHDVLVYFDTHAIPLVLKDAPDVKYAQFAPLSEALGTLVARDVPLLACPGCLKAHGNEPKDLAVGVTVAKKEKFFNFTAGRIVTLDY